MIVTGSTHFVQCIQVLLRIKSTCQLVLPWLVKFCYKVHFVLWLPWNRVENWRPLGVLEQCWRVSYICISPACADNRYAQFMPWILLKIEWTSFVLFDHGLCQYFSLLLSSFQSEGYSTRGLAAQHMQYNGLSIMVSFSHTFYKS